MRKGSSLKVISGSHHLQAVREIEKLFVKIRRKTLDFQLHNWKDLEFIDDALVHTVERIILPRSLAQVMMAELAGSIERATNISFVDYAGMKQQWPPARKKPHSSALLQS